MYTFDPKLCTDKFAGMIHGLAVTAALANRIAFTMLPVVEYGERIAAVTVNFTPPQPRVSMGAFFWFGPLSRCGLLLQRLRPRGVRLQRESVRWRHRR